jgi:MoaA/NifB/PqqE/SkfB family radical SAM enzyme
VDGSVVIDVRLPARPPVALVVPIIDVCGGRCTMCGIWQREPRPPFPPERLAEILGDPDLGGSLTHVNVTGGEPVDHPRFADIAAVLSSACPALVEVNVNTSGLDAAGTAPAIEAFREALAPHVAMMATVSLDGIGAVHDRVRGVKGAFTETSRAIAECAELARRRGDLRVHVNCTVSRHNMDGVGEVVEWVRGQGLGLTLTLAAANDLYLGNVDRRARFELSAEQADDLAARLDAVQDDDWFPATERHYYEMAAHMLRGGERSCRCVYQTSGVFLDLDGTLYPCGTAEGLPYGRLPEQAFGDIYFGPHGDAVRRDVWRRLCPTCPTNSYHGLADGVWLDVLKKRRAQR